VIWFDKQGQAAAKILPYFYLQKKQIGYACFALGQLPIIRNAAYQE
jgi:hypothetical protein